MLSADHFNKPSFLAKQNGAIKYYSGELKRFRSLDDLEELQDQHQNDLVFVAPFCAARDNGMQVKGDEDMLVIVVDKVLDMTESELDKLVEGAQISFSEEIHPDISDDDFAAEVTRINVTPHSAYNFQATSEPTGSIPDFSIFKWRGKLFRWRIPGTPARDS
jgi:hypothetical protein